MSNENLASPNNEKEEIRIPVRLTRSAHPILLEVIERTPRRYRSERIRILMEKGLLYEENSRLFEALSKGSYPSD